MCLAGSSSSSNDRFTATEELQTGLGMVLVHFYSSECFAALALALGEVSFAFQSIRLATACFFGHSSERFAALALALGEGFLRSNQSAQWTLVSLGRALLHSTLLVPILTRQLPGPCGVGWNTRWCPNGAALDERILNVVECAVRPQRSFEVAKGPSAAGRLFILHRGVCL